MGEKRGKLMKRVKLPDGSEVILPVDAVLSPSPDPNMTPEEFLEFLKKPTDRRYDWYQ